MPPTVYFQLGKDPELSLAELSAFFPNKIFRCPQQQIAVCEQEIQVPLDQILQLSGGLVTAGVVSTEHSSDLVSLIEKVLSAETRSLAVSFFEMGKVEVKSLLDEVKRRKKASSQSLRYVLPTAGMQEMRSAALFHEMKDRRFQHFVIWRENGEYCIGETKVVQNVDEWSTLDYGKPSRRIHEGMLPPKVARMMLNLGLGHAQSHGVAPLVYDPFSGSGTVLVEGLRVGCRVVGSDLSQEAVKSSEENLLWYAQRNAKGNASAHPMFNFTKSGSEEWRVFVGDAVHLDRYFSSREIDVVVTEPYMGPLFTEVPSMEQAKNQQKGLLKLYLGFFKSLRYALKNGGVVVFSLPFYRINGRTMRIPLIDRLEDIGYNPIIPSIDYFVEHTIVGREIIILRLEN